MFLFVSAAALVFLLLVVLSLEPRYTARALVMLDRPRVQAVEGEGYGGTDPFTLRGEVDLLWSVAVAQRVVDGMGLANMAEFASEAEPGLRERLSDTLSGLGAALVPDPGAGRPSAESGAAPEGARAADERRRQVVAEYQDRLSIINDGRSLAVGIAFEASDPEIAAAIANAHAEAYIAIKSEELTGTYRVAVEQLEAETGRSAEAARAAERAAARHLNDNPILMGGEEGADGLSAPGLGRAQTEIAETRYTIADLEATVDALAAGSEGGDALAGAVPEGALRSPALEQLREGEAAALVEIQRAVAAFGADSPAAAGAREELAAARAAIAEEIERVRGRLDAELARQRRLLASLEALLASELAEGARFNRALSAHRALQAEANARRLLYETLVQRQGELSLADGLVGADAVLVAPASAPLEPSFPRTSLLALASAMLATGAGALAALAAAAAFGSREPAPEIARRAGLPDLAQIPLPRRPGSGALRDARSWDALRQLRARLDGLARGGRLTVALTEVGPGADRALVGLGLARAFAAAGHRTLLLDADRSAADRARVHPALAAASGVTDALRGDAAPEAVIVSGGRPNLDLLPVGRLLPGDGEVLCPPALDALLARLGRSYGRIVLLAPGAASPGDVADAARAADAVVVVVRQGRRALPRLRAAAEALSRFDLAPVGFALTRQLRHGWRLALRPGEALSGDVEPPARLRHVPVAGAIRDRGAS